MALVMSLSCRLRTLVTRDFRLALAVGSLITFAPLESRADQFILFDATFTYTWDDAVNASPSQSHYYVTEENWLNPERPTNWVSPVNYAEGSVHIRIEVLEKPAGGQETGWALCYVANVGSYGCPYTPYYTEPGVYSDDVGMTAFWTDGPISWDQGIKQVDLVYTINDSGSGHVHNYPELKAQTTPTKVRITMVQVSAGDTFDPSILDETGGTGGSGGTGGGAGAGGLTGSGGLTGTGGTGTGGAASGGTATGGAATGGSAAGGRASGGAGTGGASTGGASTGGASAGNDDRPSANSGCGVARAPESTQRTGAWLLALGLAAFARRARRK